MLNNRSVLITGGTGSFGKMFTKLVLARFPKIERLVIFSRDEQKHYQMEQEYPRSKYPMMRYFIGDVRDESRLVSAFEGIDIVIHAAAMKHVHLAESNPIECIKTNILGAENVILAALKTGVEKVVALSTDKAAAPINLYGASKLAAEKIFIAANANKGKRNITFSVVRYGNMMGSNGSVIPFFLKKRKDGVLPITDTRMTRFNISPEEGCEMIFNAIKNAWGGEIFVPKLSSYKLVDVATAIGPTCRQEIVGIRPLEKLHEEMITASDSFNTVDVGKHFVILPQQPVFDVKEFMKHFKAKKVAEGFNYHSSNNDQWESVESLRKLIKKHVDPTFTI